MTTSGVRTVPVGISGAIALAAGSAAYGGIVFVAPPANVPNAASPTTASANWDVNGDATNDFFVQFRNPQTAAGSGVMWQANFSAFAGGGTNAVAGYLGTFINYATRLNNGDTVGAVLPVTVPPSTFRNQSQVCLGSFYRYLGTPYAYGQFSTGAAPAASVVRGFVGFRFLIGANTHYGWVDVEVRGADGTAGSGGIFFFGAAYEDTADAPITIPAPGSLAALALGAIACGRRSRRSA